MKHADNYRTIGQAIDHVLTRIRELGMERHSICYHASEAVYRMAGGKASGLKAMRIPYPGRESHWFLAGPNGEIIDLTAGQYKTFKRYPSYRRAVGAAFFNVESDLCWRLRQ